MSQVSPVVEEVAEEVAEEEKVDLYMDKVEEVDLEMDKVEAEEALDAYVVAVEVVVEAV